MSADSATLLKRTARSSPNPKVHCESSKRRHDDARLYATRCRDRTRRTAGPGGGQRGAGAARNVASGAGRGGAGAVHQRGPVWFLGGVSPGGAAERRCSVPGGKALLFPII